MLRNVIIYLKKKWERDEKFHFIFINITIKIVICSIYNDKSE